MENLRTRKKKPSKIDPCHSIIQYIARACPLNPTHLDGELRKNVDLRINPFENLPYSPLSYALKYFSSMTQEPNS